MGLDNGFVLRSTKDTEMEINLVYMRKYYELDRWGRSNFQPLGDENYKVTQDDLYRLLNVIEPVYNILRRLKGNIQYYDEMGYPKIIKSELFNNDFDPTESESYASGAKLMRLYSYVITMLSILDDYGDKGLYIEFFSSY